MSPRLYFQADCDFRAALSSIDDVPHPLRIKQYLRRLILCHLSLLSHLIPVYIYIYISCPCLDETANIFPVIPQHSDTEMSANSSLLIPIFPTIDRFNGQFVILKSVRLASRFNLFPMFANIEGSLTDYGFYSAVIHATCTVRLILVVVCFP
jgi:hypothetical protein